MPGDPAICDREWRVPVDRAPVSLLLEGGGQHSGHVFLQTATELGRRQTVLDLLNGPHHFLALEREGRLTLLHKDTIRWVEGEGDLLPPDDGIPPRLHPVRLQFASGVEVIGEAHIVAPPGRRRVTDLLNGPEPFFAMQVAGRTRIVHKAHILLIEPMET